MSFDQPINFNKIFINRKVKSEINFKKCFDCKNERKWKREENFPPRGKENSLSFSSLSGKINQPNCTLFHLHAQTTLLNFFFLLVDSENVFRRKRKTFSVQFFYCAWSNALFSLNFFRCSDRDKKFKSYIYVWKQKSKSNETKINNRE